MQTRPPDVIINRKTKEVTRFSRLSEEACSNFLAPIVLRMALEEQQQKQEKKKGRNRNDRSTA